MGKPIRALVVEDDRSWQQIVAELLTDAGLTVDAVDCLRDAVAALRAAPHRIAVVDLALGDGDFDNQDGLRVLEAIRRQDPGCAAIMLTGLATVELAVSALNEYGALTCLRKEAFNRAEFRALIQQALAQPPPGTAVEPKAPGPRPLGAALVVDDDAGWRNILAEMLIDAGYEVRLCSSYGEALGCLRRDRYALAVVDLALAGPVAGGGRHNAAEKSLDGYRLLADTRTSGIPTIVVSGVAGAEEIERAYSEQGVLACVQKQTLERRAFLQTVQDAQTAHAAGRDLGRLTGRERQVLALLARGMTNKEIAQTLLITTNTVKRHVKSVFAKLDVHTRAAAAAKAVAAGAPPT